MPSSTVTESNSSAQRGVSSRRRRRGPSLRRRIREKFPRYRVRRIVFFFFLGIATIGAGYTLGRYQPSDSSSAE